MVGDMAKEISVIIPTRNEFKNLMWTLQAAQADLEDRDYELIVVMNLCDPEEAEKLRKYWPFKVGRGKVIEYNDKPSCWQARNAGAAAAEGDYLLFLDSHVIPSTGSFSRLLDYHKGWKGVAHCALNYWLEPPEKTLHGYKWQPEKFWGTWTRLKPKPPDYRILLSGTSSSLIDRDVFEEIGGFHPAFGTYGGGEAYIDLKVQMFGYEVRMPPGCRLWHLTEQRGYFWTNEGIWFNFMVAAYALGGDKYIQTYYDNVKAKIGERYHENLTKIRDDAIAAGQEDREFIEANAKFTLDEVISTWDDERIES